jgi:hypothetical protein
MNYTIGYVNGFRQQNMREAAPFFYKATQYNSSIKTSHVPYAAIGQMYLDDYTKQAADYKTKYEATPDTPEAQAALGMIRATADRAMDAFARAYTYAKSNTKIEPSVSKDLYDTITQFYKFRYPDQTTGMDAFVASVANRPLPDPASTITPVTETTPTTATSGSTATTVNSNTTTTNTTTTTGTTNAGATPAKNNSNQTSTNTNANTNNRPTNNNTNANTNNRPTNNNSTTSKANPSSNKPVKKSNQK